jgi:hypothetical protein
MTVVRAAGLLASTAAALGLAATSQAPQAAGQSLAAPFPRATSTSAAEAGGLLAREVASLTREGIPPAHAREAVEVEQQIARVDLPSKLSGSMGNGFGGVWFDPAAARLHVGVTSPAAQRAAEGVARQAGLAADVMVTPVPSSWRQLTATQKRWNRRLAHLLAREEIETALAPQNNSVTVTLGSSVPAREQATIEREAARSPVNVRVDEVAEPRITLIRDANLTTCNKFAKRKAYCNKPITPGVTIERQDGATCTGGPLVLPKKDKQRTYLITAGHCVNDGLIREKWFAFTTGGVRSEIGRSASYRNDTSGDVGVVIVNRPGAWTREGNTPVFAVTAEWEKLSETSFSVISQKEPAVGDSNCMVGQASGGGCGKVEAVGVTIGRVEQLAEDSVKVLRRGDSGGPVIVETEASSFAVEGSIVGKRRSNNNGVFEPLARALTLLTSLHLELVSTGNEVRPAESLEEKSENENIVKLENEEQEKREKEEKEKPLITPTPTESAPLEFTSTSGKTLLETTGGKRLECKEGSTTGKFNAVREGATTFTLHGCKYPALGLGCNTSGQASETISTTGVIELVDLEKTKPTLAMEIELGEPEVKCAGVPVVVEGTMIGEVSGVESGKKTKTATAIFKQEKGKQAIQECHLTATFCKEKVFMLEASVSGGTDEETGLEVEEKITFGKEVAFEF